MANLLFFTMAFMSPLMAAVHADEVIQPFNGKDLTGWVAEGNTTKKVDGKLTQIWSVKDKMIVCDGKGYGFLRFDTKLDDFIFELEYNMAEKCNSGIGLRAAKFSGKARKPPSMSGFELQILDDSGKKPGNHSSMSLYRYLAATENTVLPAGKWNKFKVDCRGPKIRVTLNGKIVHDIDQTKHKSIQNKPLSGYVSLQNHNHTIRFRNLKITRLDKSAKK